MPFRALKTTARLIILVGAVIATIWIYRAYLARSLPDLEVWHTYTPMAEFRAADFPDGISFAEYRKLETRLFDELDKQVFVTGASGNSDRYNRYDKNSIAYAGEAEQRWNRSFELRPPDAPRGGVLFIHGASDSPYSARAISRLFHDHGMYVLAVRLPGNGTIPSGLRDARLEDWRAITRMGVQQVRSVIGADLPLYVAGYSVGGALALDYALDAIDKDNLDIPDRLFLVSPAIGIAPAARLSSWDIALSKLPVFEKFAWWNIEPEFDPYKYNSFAKNAGHIIHILTADIRRKMSGQARSAALPPIITFQSLADTTVRTEELAEALYSKLPNNGSELILFDINRASNVENFIGDFGQSLINDLGTGAPKLFSYTLVTNASRDTLDVVARTRSAGALSFEITSLGLRWPETFYSLTHVALPFTPDDRWYGAAEQGVFKLGGLAPRGETAILITPIHRFMRLRHNPFFDYLATRTLQFCEACAR
ncbi:MAG: alpha/beta fold hydrolase [Proteobacteria bacterium]|nr:alpha/beta fold hydrolase [Pseudomonadota bacterium]